MRFSISIVILFIILINPIFSSSQPVEQFRVELGSAYTHNNDITDFEIVENNVVTIDESNDITLWNQREIIQNKLFLSHTIHSFAYNPEFSVIATIVDIDNTMYLQIFDMNNLDILNNISLSTDSENIDLVWIDNYEFLILSINDMFSSYAGLSLWEFISSDNLLLYQSSITTSITSNLAGSLNSFSFAYYNSSNYIFVYINSSHSYSYYKPNLIALDWPEVFDRPFFMVEDDNPELYSISINNGEDISEYNFTTSLETVLGIEGDGANIIVGTTNSIFIIDLSIHSIRFTQNFEILRFDLDPSSLKIYFIDGKSSSLTYLTYFPGDFDQNNLIGEIISLILQGVVLILILGLILVLFIIPGLGLFYIYKKIITINTDKQKYYEKLEEKRKDKLKEDHSHEGKLDQSDIGTHIFDQTF